MQGGDQLHDRMRCVFVDEACHCGILQVLQLVAQVDGVSHLGVCDVNSLLVLDFVRQELPEVGLLGEERAILVILLKVVVAAVVSGHGVRRRDRLLRDFM